MDELATYVLSDPLLKRIRPLVQEMAQQEKDAQRMRLLANVLQEQLRMLIAQEVGLTLTPELDLQLDLTRGIVRVQSPGAVCPYPSSSLPSMEPSTPNS